MDINEHLIRSTLKSSSPQTKDQDDSGFVCIVYDPAAASKSGPAPGIGDIGSRLVRQILGGANFRERGLFSDNNTLYNN